MSLNVCLSTFPSILPFMVVFGGGWVYLRFPPLRLDKNIYSNECFIIRFQCLLILTLNCVVNKKKNNDLFTSEYTFRSID